MFRYFDGIKNLNKLDYFFALFSISILALLNEGEVVRLSPFFLCLSFLAFVFNALSIELARIKPLLL
tara:strand:+ start:1222 stop:1422 length:201 start_codon:yes stop_codon:yes gene_type:complete